MMQEEMERKKQLQEEDRMRREQEKQRAEAEKQEKWASGASVCPTQGSRASLKSLKISWILFGKFKAFKSLKNGAFSVTGLKMS